MVSVGPLNGVSILLLYLPVSLRGGTAAYERGGYAGAVKVQAVQRGRQRAGLAEPVTARAHCLHRDAASPRTLSTD